MGGSLNLIASLAVDSSAVGPGVAEAEAKIKIFAASSAAAVQTINESALRLAETFKAQGANADQVAQIFKQMGITGAEAGATIEAAFQGAAVAAEGAGAAGQAAAQQIEKATVSTHQELRAVETTVGVHIPRAMTSIIAEMPALQNAIAMAFDVAIIIFAVEEIYKAGEAVHKYWTEWIGAGEALKKYNEQQRDFTLTHISTLAGQQKALDMTKQQISDMSELADLRKKVTLNTVDELKAISQGAAGMAAYSGNITLATGAVLSRNDAIAREAFLEQQLQTELGKTFNLDKALADAMKLRDEQQKAVERDTQERGRLSLDILRSQAEAYKASGDKLKGLRLELTILGAEEKAAITEAGTNLDKQIAQHEIYKNKRIALEEEITKEQKKEGDKRIKQWQHEHDEGARIFRSLYADLETQNTEYVNYLVKETEKNLKLDDDIAKNAGQLTIELGREQDRQTEKALSAANRQMEIWDRKQQHIIRAEQNTEINVLRSQERMLIGTIHAFDGMTQAVRGWGGVTLKIIMQIIEATIQETIMDEINAVEHAKNSALKANADIISMEKMAYPKFHAAMAAGFDDLAHGLFWPAAMEFASAAEWATVMASPAIGAVAAVALAGGGGGGGGAGGFGRTAGATGSAGPAPSGEQAPGYAQATSTQPSGKVNVLILGDADGAQWLSDVISNHVRTRNGRLYASHSLRVASGNRSS